MTNIVAIRFVTVLIKLVKLTPVMPSSTSRLMHTSVGVAVHFGMRQESGERNRTSRNSMLMATVAKLAPLFVVAFVVDLTHIVVGVVFIRLEKMSSTELAASVPLLLTTRLLPLSRPVRLVMVWTALAVLNIVATISVRISGRIIGPSVFTTLRSLTSEPLPLLSNEGTVKMLEKRMPGLKTKLITETLTTASRTLLGIPSPLRLTTIVRFINDTTIGKAAKLFSVMGRLLSGPPTIRLILPVVTSSRNRLTLTFALRVILRGKPCKT